MSVNQFNQYPLYLKYSDIMDMLQVSKSKAYSLIHEFTAQTRTKSRLGVKSVRVPRDRFVSWLLEADAA